MNTVMHFRGTIIIMFSNLHKTDQKFNPVFLQQTIYYNADYTHNPLL